MFGVSAVRWQALEDAVERICEDAMPTFDACHGQSRAIAQDELERTIWNTVKRTYLRFARLRNATNPALRLPDEVLEAIFACLETPALVVASHVCQTWREVALHRPTLWARLDARAFKPVGLYHLLNRSQPLPLDLKLLILPSNALDQAYSASSHMARLVHLTIHIDSDDPETRSPRERSDVIRSFASIPAVLITPSPFMRRLTVRDPHRTLRMIGNSLFDQQVPALRFLDYHGDISLYPFMLELSNITHFSYAPVFLGQLQLDALYSTLDMCCNLQHFALHIPVNYTFPVLDPQRMPEGIKHFELHVHTEDADIAHFLPFFATPRPLLVIALHAKTYHADGCQRFLTSALQSRRGDITAAHLEFDAHAGVATIASADAAGRQMLFCDFPRECPPLDVAFAHVASLSIGDTFWTLSPPPALPRLAALALHVSALPARHGGVLMQPPARSGRSVLLCPMLQTLVLVSAQAEEPADFTVDTQLVVAFVRTRLAFGTPRLRRLVLKQVLLEGDSVALNDVFDEIVDDGTPWAWAGVSMASAHGTDQCSLPLHAGVFRGQAAQSIADWW